MYCVPNSNLYVQNWYSEAVGIRIFPLRAQGANAQSSWCLKSNPNFHTRYLTLSPDKLLSLGQVIISSTFKWQSGITKWFSGVPPICSVLLTCSAGVITLTLIYSFRDISGMRFFQGDPDITLKHVLLHASVSTQTAMWQSTVLSSTRQSCCIISVQQAAFGIFHDFDPHKCMFASLRLLYYTCTSVGVLEWHSLSFTGTSKWGHWQSSVYNQWKLCDYKVCAP